MVVCASQPSEPLFDTLKCAAAECCALTPALHSTQLRMWTRAVVCVLSLSLCVYVSLSCVLLCVFSLSLCRLVSALACVVVVGLVGAR